jgi:hypothetical protein
LNEFKKKMKFKLVFIRTLISILKYTQTQIHTITKLEFYLYYLVFVY